MERKNKMADEKRIEDTTKQMEILMLRKMGVDVVLDIALSTVADGTFKGDVYNLGMSDNAVAVLMSDNLPEDVKAVAQEAIDKIISGELEVVRDYTLR